jgi:hypothetical protein
MLRNAAADAAVACLCTAMLALLTPDSMTISREQRSALAVGSIAMWWLAAVAFVLPEVIAMLITGYGRRGTNDGPAEISRGVPSHARGGGPGNSAVQPACYLLCVPCGTKFFVIKSVCVESTLTRHPRPSRLQSCVCPFTLMSVKADFADWLSA